MRQDPLAEVVQLKRVEADNGRGRVAQALKRFDASIAFPDADRSVVAEHLYHRSQA